MEHLKNSPDIRDRLESLRKVLRTESISYGELIELQSLARYVEDDDVELLEAAGVPEFERREFWLEQAGHELAHHLAQAVDGFKVHPDNARAALRNWYSITEHPEHKYDKTA